MGTKIFLKKRRRKEDKTTRELEDKLYHAPKKSKKIVKRLSELNG